MDTSEEYIKMCDCPEIQGEWAFPCFSDWVYNFRECLTGQLVNPQEGDTQEIIENNLWLPRQDQIQKMMGYEIPIYALAPFATFLWRHFKTWEQLWLAFYVYEKHDKVWDGEKWEKRNEDENE